jgi:lipopolysaccharide transport system ATP-binding protein
MSYPVIQVENLGKKYILGHQQEGNSQYGLLRESISDGARSVVRRLRHPGKRQLKSTQEEFWALRDVSFEVKQGEVVGIIGRNGAGKSTLLKILSRITEPTTGRIKLRGRVASLLEVGTGFHPELTGRENIFLNGAILGMSRAEINRKFDEIVEFAEVSRFLDTPVKRYSSGMYVRLAFAVAAHLEPEILVVDEVLAVGDAAFQKKCLGKMGDVAKNEGRTVLFVSHNMTAMQTLCNTAIWIDRGEVKAQGGVNSILRNYLDSIAYEQDNKKIWTLEDAPGNERMKWLRIEIEPTSPCDEVTVETELKCIFEFWNYQEGATLNFSLVLYNIEGIIVFNSCSSPVGLQEGIICGECVIPGNLLNDETYQVTIMLVEDTSKVIHKLEKVLTFQVQDSPRQFNWYGKWVGLVRPELAWKVEKIRDRAAQPYIKN